MRPCREDLRDERSFASFAVAVNYSTSRLAESLAKKGAEGEEARGGVERGRGIPQCEIIDIAQARKLGVLPIAFQNGEEFAWYDYSEDEAREEVTVEEMEAEDAEAGS